METPRKRCRGSHSTPRKRRRQPFVHKKQDGDPISMEDEPVGGDGDGGGVSRVCPGDYTEGSEDKYGDGGGDEPHRDVNPADLRLINQLQLDLEKAQAELRTQGDTTKKALEDKDKALADKDKALADKDKLEEENSTLKKKMAEWAKKFVQVNKIKVRLDQHFIDELTEDVEQNLDLNNVVSLDTTKALEDKDKALADKDKALADAREENGKLEEELKKKAEWAKKFVQQVNKIKVRLDQHFIDSTKYLKDTTKEMSDMVDDTTKKALEDKDKALADAREKNGKLEEDNSKLKKKMAELVKKIREFNELTEDVKQNLDLSK